MKGERSSMAGGSGSGFVLPMVLMVVASMVMLVVATLVISSRDGRVAGIWVDHTRAGLAVDAGLAEVSAVLLNACAREPYLVIGESSEREGQFGRLYAVNSDCLGGAIRHQFVPLFSTSQQFDPVTDLAVPKVGSIARADCASIRAKPWLMPAEVEWLPVHDDEGKLVSRYAYWVEDLQGLLDPTLDANGLAWWALDPDSSERDLSVGLRRLLARGDLLVSPESALAAAGFQPPLLRLSDGHLSDDFAAALERHVVVGREPYDEPALVPFVPGLAGAVMGWPKMNLNRLLVQGGDSAVRQMAAWMERGLPEFDQRKGGFPENYLMTLAASALDYADLDGEPLRSAGEYQGVDAHPFLSELVLHLHFQQLVREGDRWVMRWTLRLFGELWNMTNQPINGAQVNLSYEVNLTPTPTGLGGLPRAFDDPELLRDRDQSQHQLEWIEDRFYSPAIEVSLKPDEYRFYEFARVDYRIDCTPQLDAAGQPWPEWFDLIEQESQMRGITLRCNGRPVQRLARITRDPHGLGDFRTDRSRKAAKACIPGLNYGMYRSSVNNPGDPRIAAYLRQVPLGENAYPENLSPNRRNIRRRNIYDKDPSPLKTRHYGRVQPSQWPDGGHDSPTGNFRVTTSDAALPTDPDKWPLHEVPEPQAGNAPQRISNAGRFYSVTEFGHVHDPLMWTPCYPDLAQHAGSGADDTAILLGSRSIFERPAMPLRRMRWPEVSLGSQPSRDHGGGNTLRVGRPEHERFDRPGLSAQHLLDLFHCGIADSADPHEREGPLVRVAGQVNVNTASREVLRCLVAGHLRQDPGLCRVIDWRHELGHALGPRTRPLEFDASSDEALADRVADALMANRPYGALSQLASAKDGHGRPVFGNPEMHFDDGSLQWSDAAAEERFARLHDLATLSSRNFRVWLVGQRVVQKGEGVEVLARQQRVVTLFVDPGERDAGGRLIPENQQIRVLHVRDF